MSKFPSQEMDRFNLRLPEGMRELIAERARRNGRSMNSEILQILVSAIYLDDQPDAWVEKLMAYIDSKDPSNEEDRELFAMAIHEAIKEVTKRIETENERLISIANAQAKFLSKTS
ncbi:Arc family DNA-binding protein [Cronobacter sakazakii]|uniref:Arc family DNA-binding protein n=1 Tax=Cronobacter sakazakii TaxID=28141 RepID=UPI000CFDAB83|nr:Arc family DNA-binding protein [Cronobacter sakazakii]ELQ6045543.1 Arc family DNA-binding protein [Cronobacter malonaticus]EGT4306808.1 Arc family DNA-binding protein [Cronobacter sakazakii]EGT4327567.1 Arc family DNA-binding protein [Cronobacter sakazakii]EGT4365178.1 Arc family DNA-binding protein [Cronobacter sakazakii]EGT4427262.1 Arc family DNA-binding protein [Cronobacter sakazakii]